MQPTIVFPNSHEQIDLMAIKPHDSKEDRQMIRHVAWRIKARQLTVEEFVIVLIEEAARMIKDTGYHDVRRVGLVRRIKEIIDDLVTDRDLAEDAKDHFREKWLEEEQQS